MATSDDPDETACDEPSHLDLHCLQNYLYLYALLIGPKMYCVPFNCSIELRELGTIGDIFAIFYKGDYLCDFLFAFLRMKPLLK